MERKLIHIPTIHGIGELQVDKSGIEDAAAKIDLISSPALFLASVEESFTKFNLDFKKLKVFPEGFSRKINDFSALEPVHPYPFAKAFRIAYETMEENGIQNAPQTHLTFALSLAGAKLIDTEHVRYYKSSLKIIRKMDNITLQASGGDIDKEFDTETLEKVNSLAERLSFYVLRRDKHYARVINQNLEDSEVGIFIAGAQHNPLEWLDPDIRVEFLNPTLAEFFKQKQAILNDGYATERVVNLVL